jgi:hypothetical protein
MNAREGLRRIGLVAGVLGASLGAVVSYGSINDIIQEKVSAATFRSLASSAIVREQLREFKAIKPPPGYEFYEPGTVNVNKGGIKTIHLGDKLEITSIDTQDGAKLIKPVPVGFWSYVLPVIFPVVGFLIPWGVVRTATWVGAGFLSHPK